MQNIDLYSGSGMHGMHRAPSSFTVHESDFFNRVRENTAVDQEKLTKRASRIIFLIAALCIIAFTTGLAVGIKFAGGENTQIVDDATYEAIHKGVSSIMNTGREAVQKERFPAAEFPYALKVGTTYSKSKAVDIAAYIHAKGHVVLLPKDKSNKNLYSIYVGPYKSEAEAQESMKKLGADQKFIAENSVNIIKRSETK